MVGTEGLDTAPSCQSVKLQLQSTACYPAELLLFSLEEDSLSSN